MHFYICVRAPMWRPPAYWGLFQATQQNACSCSLWLINHRRCSPIRCRAFLPPCLTNPASSYVNSLLDVPQFYCRDPKVVLVRQARAAECAAAAASTAKQLGVHPQGKVTQASNRDAIRGAAWEKGAQASQGDWFGFFYSATVLPRRWHVAAGERDDAAEDASAGEAVRDRWLVCQNQSAG